MCIRDRLGVFGAGGMPADTGIETLWQDALRRAEKEVGGGDKNEFVYKIAYYLIEALYESNSAKPEDKPKELKDLTKRMDEHEDPIDQYWEEALERAKTDVESVMF